MEGCAGRALNWGNWLLRMKGLRCWIWWLRLVWGFGGGGIIIEISVCVVFYLHVHIYMDVCMYLLYLYLCLYIPGFLSFSLLE